MGFAELRNEFKDAQNESDSDSDSSDTETSDYETRPYAQIYPRSAISFEDIVDVFYPDQIWDDGPVVDANGDIGLVLKAPHVVDGDLYRSRGRGDDTIARMNDDAAEYIDYKAIDLDNDGTEEDFDREGNLKGVTPSENAGKYDGEMVETFSEDTVTLWLSGKSAKWAARTLDVNGEPLAQYDDDEHTQGLVETNPDRYDDDKDPDVFDRFARLPQLRDIDFEGHGGGFINLIHLSDVYPDADRGYYVILGFNDFEGDNVQDATILEPVENPDAVEFEDAALVWHDEPSEFDSDDTDSDGDDDDTDGSGGSGSFAVPVNEAMTREEFLDGMPMAERRFVHNCVVECGIQPDTDVVETVVEDGFDDWHESVAKRNYEGEETVDTDFAEHLRDITEGYADIVDGEIDAVREEGIPVDN